MTDTVKDMAHLTSEQLQHELTRRRNIEAEERERQLLIREELAFEHIDALIALTPHGRTSCSDENPQNGIGSRREGGYRCERCFLLDVKERGSWPHNASLSLDIPPVRVPANREVNS